MYDGYSDQRGQSSPNSGHPGQAGGQVSNSSEALRVLEYQQRVIDQAQARVNAEKMNLEAAARQEALSAEAARLKSEIAEAERRLQRINNERNFAVAPVPRFGPAGQVAIATYEPTPPTTKIVPVEDDRPPSAQWNAVPSNAPINSYEVASHSTRSNPNYMSHSNNIGNQYSQQHNSRYPQQNISNQFYQQNVSPQSYQQNYPGQPYLAQQRPQAPLLHQQTHLAQGHEWAQSQSRIQLYPQAVQRQPVMQQQAPGSFQFSQHAPPASSQSQNALAYQRQINIRLPPPTTSSMPSIGQSSATVPRPVSQASLSASSTSDVPSSAAAQRPVSQISSSVDNKASWITPSTVPPSVLQFAQGKATPIPERPGDAQQSRPSSNQPPNSNIAVLKALQKQIGSLSQADKRRLDTLTTHANEWVKQKTEGTTEAIPHTSLVIRCTGVGRYQIGTLSGRDFQALDVFGWLKALRAVNTGAIIPGTTPTSSSAPVSTTTPSVSTITPQQLIKKPPTLATAPSHMTSAAALTATSKTTPTPIPHLIQKPTTPTTVPPRTTPSLGLNPNATPIPSSIPLASMFSNSPVSAVPNTSVPSMRPSLALPSMASPRPKKQEASLVSALNSMNTVNNITALQRPFASTNLNVVRPPRTPAQADKKTLARDILRALGLTAAIPEKRRRESVGESDDRATKRQALIDIPVSAAQPTFSSFGNELGGSRSLASAVTASSTKPSLSQEQVASSVAGPSAPQSVVVQVQSTPAVAVAAQISSHTVPPLVPSTTTPPVPVIGQSALSPLIAASTAPTSLSIVPQATSSPTVTTPMVSERKAVLPLPAVLQSASSTVTTPAVSEGKVTSSLPTVHQSTSSTVTTPVVSEGKVTASLPTVLQSTSTNLTTPAVSEGKVTSSLPTVHQSTSSAVTTPAISEGKVTSSLPTVHQSTSSAATTPAVSEGKITSSLPTVVQSTSSAVTTPAVSEGKITSLLPTVHQSTSSTVASSLPTVLQLAPTSSNMSNGGTKSIIPGTLKFHAAPSRNTVQPTKSAESRTFQNDTVPTTSGATPVHPIRNTVFRNYYSPTNSGDSFHGQVPLFHGPVPLSFANAPVRTNDVSQNSFAVNSSPRNSFPLSFPQQQSSSAAQTLASTPVQSRSEVPLFLPGSRSPSPAINVDEEASLYPAESETVHDSEDDTGPLEKIQSMKTALKTAPKNSTRTKKRVVVEIPPTPAWVKRDLALLRKSRARQTEAEFKDKDEEEEQEVATEVIEILDSDEETEASRAKEKVSRKTHSSRSTTAEVVEPDYSTVRDPQELSVLKKSITRLQRVPCKWGGCEAVLNSIENLGRHMRAHVVESQQAMGKHGDSILCKVCGNYPVQVSRHVENHAYHTLFCPYTDCEESFRSSRKLMQHALKDHGMRDRLRPSANPFHAPPTSAPDSPPTLPSYMVVARAVTPHPISKERHQLLGPWVLKNMIPPIDSVSLKRYLKSKHLGTVVTPNTADEYDFLMTRSSPSCIPSRPAKVRDFRDLNSDQVSTLVSDGMSFWVSKEAEENINEPRSPTGGKKSGDDATDNAVGNGTVKIEEAVPVEAVAAMSDGQAERQN